MSHRATSDSSPRPDSPSRRVHSTRGPEHAERNKHHGFVDVIRRGVRSRVVQAAFGVLGAVGAATGGVSGDSRADIPDNAVGGSAIAGGVDVRPLPEMTKSFSPHFDATVDTFLQAYGTKPGTVFFIDRDGAIVGSAEIPRKILVMQVDADSNVRGKFKNARLSFIHEARKKLPKKYHDASFILGHDKFSSVERRVMEPYGAEDDAENLLDACRRFFAAGLAKTRLGETLNDEEKQRLSDLTMGLLGIESGFLSNLTSSAGARGIMQFMPSILEKYHLSGKKVTNPKFAVPKVAAYFSDMADVLLKAGGVSDIMETYHLPKTFLLYCVVQSYNSGVGNVRALARAFLKMYPTPDVFRKKIGDRVNSEEVFFALVHRLPASAVPSGFGRNSKRYVPQICAMGEHLKRVSRERGDLAKSVSDR